MYVYKQSEPSLWTVGHYGPDGKFVPESDHESVDVAAARVHYLNGGSDPASWFSAWRAYILRIQGK